MNTYRAAAPGPAPTGIVGVDGAIRRSVLPGGIRVVSERVPGAMSVAVGCWVPVGSRHERPAAAGAAHFLEHLLFRGTETRTGAGISEEMDAVGGDLNAFTGREYTCYHAQVLPEDLPLAVDLLTDVTLRARCSPEDVEIEGQVVLEELAMRDDDPEDLAADLYFESVFPGHPLGRPIIGTAETIESLTSRRLRYFHRSHYRPERLVVAAAGAVDHDELCAAVSRYAGVPPDSASGAAPGPPRASRAPSRAPALRVVGKDAEQVQLNWGVRIPGRTDGGRWALSVLNSVIGGGLSSRLFRAIREERGLAYSVYSTLDLFTDTGSFSIGAAFAPENLDEVLELTRATLADIAENGVTEGEVARARGQIRGAVVLGHEDPHSRMCRLGRHELGGVRRTLADTLDRVSRVTADEVSAAAHAVLALPAAAALVGPVEVGELPRVLGPRRTLTGVPAAR